MILNSIALHNFMSYADATIDLAPVHIACLTGRNGAGKSAILDAVTWALWECARASSEELVRLGQSQMWVDVRFNLGDQQYRVRRSRSRNAARPGGRLVSRGTLDLQVLSRDGKVRTGESNESQSRWISLNAPSMRETQARICELLKMEYDTFINSVYLRQGRADEFTKRSAGERKEVLADILGLRYFDRLQDLARDESRCRKAKIDQLQAGMPDIADMEARQESLADKLQEISANLESVQADLSRTRKQTHDARAGVDEATEAERVAALCLRRIEEFTGDLSRSQARAVQCEERLRQFKDVISRAPEIESARQQIESLSAEIQILDAASLQVEDLLQKRNELRSQLASQRGRLEVELDHLREQAAAQAARRKKLLRDTKEKDKIEQKYAEYKNLLAQEALLARQQESHASLLSRSESLQSAITGERLRLENDIEARLASLREIEALIASKNHLDEQYASLLRRATELDRIDTRFSLIEETGLKVKGDMEAIEAQIRELRRRMQENDEKKRELQQQPDAGMCPLCAAPIVDRAAVTTRYENLNRALATEISSLESKLTQLESKRAQLREDYSELRQQLNARKHLDVQIGEYNERKSAVARAELLKETTKMELAELQARISAQDYAQVERESLIAVKAEIHKLDFDPVIFANLQAQVRAQRHVEARYHQLQRDLAELEELDRQLPLLEEQVSSASGELKNDTFGQEIRRQLHEIDSSIAAHNYDQARHSLVRQMLSELVPMVESIRSLDQALAEVSLQEAALHDAREHAASIESRIQAQEEELQAAHRALADLEERQALLEECSQRLLRLEEEEKQLIEERASLKTELEHIERRLDELRSHREDLSTLVAEMQDFDRLAEAFGKKGLQALIIENAIPELETEANRILSRLTDNQLHVGLITQQRTKSGNPIETLDIVIADDQGTRSYELYSGGEAFKVDFALRLALSRLLIRRAGARLETLIIDEGFGTQDEESRLRLLKAINRVAGDFSRVIVVSHIADVKEMFPSQIHITKESGISTAALLV